MNRSALEWYEFLSKGMIWAAIIVLLLSIIGAVIVAGSDSALPSFEEAERQGRGFFALAALGGGITSAGLLGGIGAILRLMVADRLAKLPPADERDEATPPLPPISPGERSGHRADEQPRERKAEKKPRTKAQPKPRKRAEKQPPRKRAEKQPPRKPAEKDRDEE